MNSNTEEKSSYTLKIRPQKKLWHLDFGESWRYRDLIGLFVRRNIVEEYKQTILVPLLLSVVIFNRGQRTFMDTISPVMKAIEFKHVGKQYRLGTVSTGTFSHDLNRWWTMKVLGKEDPFLRIGDSGNKEGEDFVWALRDIDFSVEQGDVVGIIGKNGAIMGMTRREIDRKFDDIVDFSGCGRYIDTPVKRYSSGMTVRLGFSVAAHLEPDILIVDEVLAVGDAEFQKKAIGKMQDVSRGNGRTVLFVSHNMAAVRSLCQKGIVLRDGRTDYMGGIDDAVQHYQQSATGAVEEQKLMVDGINKVKSFLKIADIQINGTPYNHTALSHDQRVLDVLIKGTTSEEMRCAVQLVFRSLDGMALASFAEGRYKSHLVDIQPGDFEIARHIALPQYLADGDFTVDLYIHEPEVQDFLEAKSIQTLHIEGRHDPYAQNLRLDEDGFVGFESI